MKGTRYIPELVSAIAMTDQPDGFHRSHGCMTAKASVYRVLHDYDADAAREELLRIESRLAIDQFGKEYGETGMPLELVEALQTIEQLLLILIGGEL